MSEVFAESCLLEGSSTSVLRSRVGVKEWEFEEGSGVSCRGSGKRVLHARPTARRCTQYRKV